MLQSMELQEQVSETEQLYNRQLLNRLIQVTQLQEGMWLGEWLGKKIPSTHIKAMCSCAYFYLSRQADFFHSKVSIQKKD